MGSKWSLDSPRMMRLLLVLAMALVFLGGLGIALAARGRLGDARTDVAAAITPTAAPVIVVTNTPTPPLAAPPTAVAQVVVTATPEPTPAPGPTPAPEPTAVPTAIPTVTPSPEPAPPTPSPAVAAPTATPAAVAAKPEPPVAKPEAPVPPPAAPKAPPTSTPPAPPKAPAVEAAPTVAPAIPPAAPKAPTAAPKAPPAPKIAASAPTTVNAAAGREAVLRCPDQSVVVTVRPDTIRRDLALSCRMVDEDAVPPPPGPIIADLVFLIEADGGVGELPAEVNLGVAYEDDDVRGQDEQRLILGMLEGGQWRPAPKPATDAPRNFVSATISRAGIYAVYRR